MTRQFRRYLARQAANESMRQQHPSLPRRLRRAVANKAARSWARRWARQ